MPSPFWKRLAVIVALAGTFLPAGEALASRKSPVDGGKITSGVGWRVDPFGSGRMIWHNGYDISVPVGTPVHPVERGTVYFAGTYKGYGEMVVIDHGNGYVTIYGHNSAIKVKAGDVVDSTTVIALSGNTGRSTGPHVHYELRYIGGTPKEQRARVENNLKQTVQDKVGGWVEDYVSGKGGNSEITILPDGEGQ
ncbi:M23 family metallopeptidase [Geomesophilobacter sediminis]|uniref:M23 family metallopeptidase n=1 Tax=Geomesophilobacter sediminis TaxID=2798584 RepID=A0A8J7IRA8_9BACT|nr:M23 family metallopeptidase [Geomesophilobacter sediminis]MBJ6725389.1 M23 family metallopeptidase [Geomesophilobacter sediminis]